MKLRSGLQPGVPAAPPTAQRAGHLRPRHHPPNGLPLPDDVVQHILGFATAIRHFWDTYHVVCRQFQRCLNKPGAMDHVFVCVRPGRTSLQTVPTSHTTSHNAMRLVRNMNFDFRKEQPWIVTKMLRSLTNFVSLRCLHLFWPSSLQTTTAVDSYLGTLATAAPRLTSLCLELSGNITSTELASLAPLTMLQDLCIYFTLSKERCEYYTLSKERGPAHGLFAEGLVRLLPQLTALQHLSLLDRYDFDADALRALYAAGALTTLRSLNLTDCVSWVDDACLAVIARVATLQKLRVGWCWRITDAGLQALAPLGALQELGLYSLTKITDDGLKALAPLTALRDLDVRECGRTTHACHTTLCDERPGLSLECSCDKRSRGVVPPSFLRHRLLHGGI